MCGDSSILSRLQAIEGINAKQSVVMGNKTFDGCICRWTFITNVAFNTIFIIHSDDYISMKWGREVIRQSDTMIENWGRFGLSWSMINFGEILPSLKETLKIERDVFYEYLRTNQHFVEKVGEGN